ncbi:MAG: isochorismatase family protein [Pirellulaceae bacterium]|nr:isochorismatase family protein [Pirellulaceae bacterium]
MRAAALLLVLVSSQVLAADAPLTVLKRSRVEEPGTGHVVKETKETWQPGETAIIVCDMWDAHHSLNAVRRSVEMAPRMNEVLKNARGRGVLVIHAPSSCMEAYASHPGRKLAQAAPAAANLPADIGQWCRHIPSEDRGRYPIDQTKSSEDDDRAEQKIYHEKLIALGRNPKAPWKAQMKPLDIEGGDAISDSGVEIWNLLEARGIKNVVLLGVHTNMCVLGRPFGLRQMAKNGKNVVLMRDLTDTMYDPTQWPFVGHYAGTELIVQHIEKYVAPTITSVSFLGGQPFCFARNRRRIAMVIGEDEYQTWETLPKFVESDLKPLGFEVTIINADSADKHNFPGMADAIAQCDLVFISVRRRLPPQPQLDELRKHIAAGKPVIGIRTACHAWSLRNEKEQQALLDKGHAAWSEFDAEVIGGHYTNHHGEGPKTAISLAAGAKDHAILRGIDRAQLVGNGSLYKVRPLAATTTPILIGTIPNSEAEPVAWTNLAGPNQARVFNTSLGHWDDFANPAFRKLLVNGIYWTLESPYPFGKQIDELLPAAR